MNKDTDTSMPETGDDLNDLTDKISNMLATPEGADAEQEEEELSTDADPTSEDDAPDENQASEEDEGKDEPAKPAIEPPSSWDAAAKERFKALPPDLQEYVSAREQERDRATNTRLQEFAQQRQLIEQAAQHAAQLRDNYEQRLVQVTRHLESTMPEEFREIRSEADLVRLADSNPALVTKFNAWRSQLAAINQEALRIEQERQYEQQQTRHTILQSEYEAISSKWPDFVDEAKGRTIRSEISDYARGLGFSDDEINSLVDHRLVLVLRDALAGRKAQASMQQAKQKVVAKPLPKVMKPGSGERTGKTNIDAGQARRVAKSGDLNSITKTLERMLSS